MKSLRRFSLTVVFCAFAAVAMNPTHAASAAEYRFDLPVQPLADALRAVGRQTNKNVLFDPALVEGISAPALSARLSLGEAMSKLLAGTALHIRDLPPDTVVVERVDSAGNSAIGSSLWRAPDSAENMQNSAWRLAQAGGDSTDAGASTNREESGKKQYAASSSGDAGGLVLEEVIVTAQKREERLQDASMSLSVVTGEEIEKRSFVNANDFLKYVPGVEYQEKGAGSGGLRIRGIDAGVGVYVGEMPITSAVDLKLVDMERVEILRGPQGTLYGGGSMGGTLRYLPNAPDLDRFGGNVQMGYSDTSHTSDDSKNINGAINIPLVEGKLALRIAAYHFDNGGYISFEGNRLPDRAAEASASGATLLIGENGGSSKHTGVRSTLLWKPLSHFSATATYIHQNVRQGGSFEENLELGKYRDLPTSLGRLTSDGRERRFSRPDLFNLTLNLDLGSFSAVSSSSYTKIRTGEARDVSRDLRPLALGLLNEGTLREWNQEIRLSSNFDHRVNFVVGGYIDNQKNKNFEHAEWTGDLARLPDFFGPVDPNALYDVDGRSTLKQKAVFGEIYFDILETLKLTLGGRYFKYDTSSFREAHGLFEESLTDVESSFKPDAKYKVNFSYTPNRNFLLYAQFAQGYRQGGKVTPPPRNQCDVNNDGILDDTNAPVDSTEISSDFLDSYEIGNKAALFGGRLVLNSAAYRIYWKGPPVGVQSPCGFGVIVPSGDVQSQGIELESTFSMTPALIANLGLSVLDAELTEDAPLASAVKGDKLVGPPLQVNFGLEYRFDAIGHPAFVRGDYSYVDEYRAGTGTRGGTCDGQFNSNCPFPFIGGYGKLDLRAGVDIRNFRAALYGTNLTNRSDLVVTELPVYPRAWRLRPREIGVELGYKF